jgi:hypothetical protein
MSEPPCAITLYDNGQPTVTIWAPTPSLVMELVDDYIRHLSMLGEMNSMLIGEAEEPK